MKEAIDKYLDSVKFICPLVSEAELKYIESGITVSKLNIRDFYIEANSIQKQIGFVYAGLLRGFYIDNNGNQISVKFIKENEFVAHFSAFISQTPSKYYFQCLEPSIIVNIPFDHIQAGYLKYPLLERYGRLVAEEVLKILQNRIESFLFETAEMRYQKYIRDYPDLIERISISSLCSYLGIERQTLTRIRKKLSEKSTQDNTI